MFFFAEDINKCVLSTTESAHCIKVLRHSVGDIILLTDGYGHVYEVEITRADTARCEYIVKGEVDTFMPRHFHGVHVAFAPTKNAERIEWMIEKCTEIGVQQFTPLLCHFSERRTLRIDRLENIMIAASKQCLNPLFPILHPIVPFETFIENSKEELKYIAHCYNTPKQSLYTLMQAEQNTPSSRLVLIGPEGDFSQEEVLLAEKAGFVPVTLSTHRLRTETAALIAGHLLMCDE